MDKCEHKAKEKPYICKDCGTKILAIAKAEVKNLREERQYSKWIKKVNG